MTDAAQKDGDVFSKAFLNSAAHDQLIQFIGRMKTDAARLSSSMKNASIEISDINGQKVAVTLRLRQNESDPWTVRNTYMVERYGDSLSILRAGNCVTRGATVDDAMKTMARLIQNDMPATYVEDTLDNSSKTGPHFKQ